MKVSRFRIWVVLALLLGLVAAPPPPPISASDGALELFLQAGGEATAADLPPQKALRARKAALNHAALAQLQPDSAPLRLSFFPDAVFTAAFNARQESVTGGVTFSGRLVGLPGSEATLSIQDDAVFASIHTGTDLFRASSQPDGAVLIEQLDAALPAPELEPQLPPAQTAPVETLATTSDDDGTRLDVLVVYTSALSSYLGSTTLNALINTAISETNQGYLNSQVTQRVKLVGTMQVTWDEVSSAQDWWGETLSKLRDGDAPFGNVAAQRDAVRADLVTLIVKYDSYCGIGYLMTSDPAGFDDYAFTVVSSSCATGYYSFAHEQGHNEGAHHDRYTAGSSSGIYNYAYGYWMWSSALNRYTHRTIMAYDCYKYQGVSCTRVNYWSNPAVSYSGMPTGVAAGLPTAADNHLTLNNTAPFVAKFRDGLPPNAPTNLTFTDLGSTSFRLNWTDASSDETGFKVYRAPYATTTWTQITTLPAGSITFTDTGLSAGVNYSYKVVAYSGNGVSSGATVNAIHSPPSAPTTPTAVASSMIRINLTWADTSLNETNFRIERSPNGSTGWVEIAVAANNVTTYSDASLSCSVTPVPYYYRVRAYNSTGYSAYTSVANATPLVCTAPPAPSPAACVGGVKSVTIGWTNIDGETNYDVDYKLTSSLDWVDAATAAKDSVSLKLLDLLAGSRYDLRVRAHNDLGDSVYVTCSAAARYGVYLPAAFK